MIETPRLILRQWRDADRAPFGELSADAEVMRFFPAVQTQAEADAVVDRAAAHIAVHGWGMWAVERRADGAFAGIVGLQPCNARGPVLGEVEVGWRIMKPLWRQGIALEAARAALDFGLQRLGRRILSRDPREITEALSGRTQRKAARDYAEAWWQALRAWEVKTFSDLVFPDGGSHTSGSYFEPVTMGRSSSGSMTGGVLYTHILTPMGWVSESRLGKLLEEHGLGRLRAGAGLSSLIHPNGRGWRDENAPAYAAAVLQVAAELGDDRARAALQFVQV